MVPFNLNLKKKGLHHDTGPYIHDFKATTEKKKKKNPPAFHVGILAV